MEKLNKLGVNNAPPLPKQTKQVVVEDYNRVVEAVNKKIDDLVEFNYQTGTAYTLALSDMNKYIQLDNADPITLTVPLNSDVAFPIGAVITAEQTGAGAATVTGATGVIINGNVLSAFQYSILVLIKTGIDVWSCIGGITDE